LFKFEVFSTGHFFFFDYAATCDGNNKFSELSWRNNIRHSNYMFCTLQSKYGGSGTVLTKATWTALPWIDHRILASYAGALHRPTLDLAMLQ